VNAINVIHPYWHKGSLVFDDEAVGLTREPFVAGADYALYMLSQAVPGCEKRFTVRFAASKFPGATHSLTRGKAEFGGHWYTLKSLMLKGWLCPALLKYFKAAPKTIWIEITPQKKRRSK
jgi:hypothetical protein